MALANKLINGSGFSILNKLISLAANILIVPILIKGLGSSDYGFWLFLASFAGYFGLFSFGFTHELKNKVSMYSKDIKSLDELISSVFTLFSFILLCFLSFFIIESFFEFDFFRSTFNDYDLSSDSYYVLLAFVGNVLFKVFSLSIYVNTLHGLGEVDATIRLDSFVSFIFNLCFLLFLYLFSFSLLDVAIFHCGRSVLSLVVFRYKLMKIQPRLKIRLSFKALNRLKELRKGGALFFLASLLTAATSNLDFILISKMINYSEVTAFSLSQKLFIVVSGAFPIAYISWPYFTENYFKDSKEKFNKRVHELIRLNFFLKSFFFCFCVLYYELIIKLWIGDSFIQSLWVYLAFFLIYGLNTVFGIFSMLVSATSNQLILLPVSTFSFVLNASFSIMFFFYFEKTILSIILGTLISQVFLLFIWKYFLWKNLKVKVQVMKIITMMYPMLSFITLLCLLKLNDINYQYNNFLSFILLPFIIIFLYFSCIKSEERNAILKIIMKKVKK